MPHNGTAQPSPGQDNCELLHSAGHFWGKLLAFKARCGTTKPQPERELIGSLEQHTHYRPQTRNVIYLKIADS